MIAALVRTDRVRRSVPMLLGGGLVSGFVLRGVRVAVPGGVHPGEWGATAVAATLLAFTAWGTAVALLMSTGVRSRAGVLALGLPVHARTVWIARMLSIAAAAAIPAAAMTLVAAVGPLEGVLPTFDATTLELGARLFVSLLLLVSIVQAPRPDVRILGWNVRRALGLVGALAISFGVAFTPVAPWPAIEIAVAAAVVLSARTYRHIPPAFVLAGRELVLGPAERAHPAEREAPPTGNATRRALLRVFVSHPQAWFVLPLLLLYGYQTMMTYHEGRDPLMLLVLPTIWIPFVVLFSMSRMGSVDPLPIPRRRLFRWIVLPSIVTFLIGCALHAPIARLIDDPYSLVQVDRRGVRVPTEFWGIAFGEAPPAVVAPWGESHAPRTIGVFPGSAISVYNPFDAPAEATPRYAAWQARRAVSVVRGERPTAVPAPDAADPLVERMQSRESIGYRFVVEDAVGVGSSRHARAQLVLALLPLTFWLAFGRMGMHPRFSGRARSAVLILGLLAPLTLVLVTELAAMASGLPAAPACIALLVLAGKVADAFPFATIALAGCVLLAGAAVYGLLGRSFERFEAPVRPVKHAIMACGESEPM